MKLGENYNENEIRRQKELNSQVTETVDLRSFTRITPDVTRQSYNLMTIRAYNKTSCTVKLPQMIVDTIHDDTQIDLLVNKKGTTIIVKVSESGFQMRKNKSARSVFSKKIKYILEEKGIELPATYRVTKDKRIDGWVCRKEA